MKKTLLAFLVSILLTACTQNPVPTSPVDQADKTAIEEGSTIEKSQTPELPVEPKATKTQTAKQELVADAQEVKDQCSNMNTVIDSNNCYLSRAYNASLDNAKVINETCEKISLDSVVSSKCYWVFAMRMKDKSLCDEIYFTYPGDAKKDYLTRDICKKYISSSTSRAQWNLQGGVPKLGDEGVTYYGRAELTGWMEEVSLYDNMMQRFHVSDSSLIDLPLAPFGEYGFNNDFDIDTKNDSDTAKKIREHVSKENPITIIVDQIIYPNEISPQMHVSLR